jgi:hypothetical protein
MPLYPPGFIEPCLPTVTRTVPTGAGWAYEIKHDGFRFICAATARGCAYSHPAATSGVRSSRCKDMSA